MDLDLPDKSLEQTYGEPEALFPPELDLNLHENKVHQGEQTYRSETETPDERMPVDSARELHNSQVEPVDYVNNGFQYPVKKSNSASSTPSLKKANEPLFPNEFDLQNDSVESKISDYTAEGRDITNYSYDSIEEKIDCAAQSLLDRCADKTSNFEEPKSSDTDLIKRKLLPDDIGRCDEVNESAKPISLAVIEDEESRKMSEISQHELVNSDNDKMQGEITGCDNELKGDNCPSEVEPSYQEMMGVADSNLYRHPQAPNVTSSPERQSSSLVRRSARYQNGTPSPDRQLAVPIERSLDNKPSPKQETLSPLSKEEKPCSRRPLSRNHSHSPENQIASRKTASSHDQMSHGAKRKSPERAIQREPHRGDDSHRRRSRSPRKRGSPSPRRRESPRRRGRSASRSPERRRDTSRHKGDRHGRSRSRSPYARDHSRRSPRRRHSPRHRSPSSHYSRRRSPRRPWSPPANRKTGIGRPGKNLFVAGFGYVTTERDLERKFSRFGRVTDVRVVRDRRSGESRGFGFLSLERDEDADAAIRALDETEWNGRIILVEKSKAPAR